MRIARFACLTLLTLSLGAGVSTSGRAATAAPASCVAATVVGFSNCQTPLTMNKTFRYQIVGTAPNAEWRVAACGAGPCAVAHWLEGSPRAGTLKTSGCPCYAQISLSHPGETVPAIRFFSGVTMGIVASVP